MRKSLQRMFLLSGVFLVLGGCGNSADQVNSQIETLEASSLQQDLQTLIDYENQLQEDFEGSLEGEDLSNFADSSAAVFSNMDSREASLESLTESAAEYESVREAFEDISFSDDEDIGDAVTSMTENLESVSGTMDAFIPQYEEVLDAEREYFTSLGEASADYDQFTGGLETVNGHHESLGAHYQSLDESLTNLNENKDRALEIINGEDGS